MLNIFNEDCVQGSKDRLDDKSVDLLICDPPFGINETKFDRHYKRNENFVIDGYVEAPEDYLKFSTEWLEQAKRVLKDDGSIYVVSGWTNLGDILSAIKNVGFYTINHIIWKFNFGVATKNKFVTSHYHILYLKKNIESKTKFNTYCRFGAQEKSATGGSLNYKDLEDVFTINKDYKPNESKNKNKLPDSLIEKLVLYSSDEGDVVGDFFLGNFTTAIVSKRLGRIPSGFEVNTASFDYHLERLDKIEFGYGLKDLRTVVNNVPPNQGKPVSVHERGKILDDYILSSSQNMKKKEINKMLCEKYGRGKFAIKNILDSAKGDNNVC